MNLLKTIICSTFVLFGALSTFASKLVELKVVDKDYIMLFFKDGDVTFNEDITNSCAYVNFCSPTTINQLVTYGSALSTTNAATNTNWKIKSTDDANFGTAGVSPTAVYRKSKLTGMAQKDWNTGTNDYNYDWAYEHAVFLKLPSSMVQGKTYTVEINTGVNSDVNTKTFTYDIFNSKSEAVKVNLVGYSNAATIKAADVYMWMGDGAARDYSTFVGNDIYIYNVNTGSSQKVGSLSLWKTSAAEFSDNHQLIRSNVWKADFTGFNTPGTYRVAVAGVGCSEDFVISADAYFDPYKINVLGFYYMRIGEDQKTMVPAPMRPLWIPGVNPTNTKVLITTVQPYDANWGSITSDPWDHASQFATYSTGRENKNAYGGHRDAMDFDRHLGHVSIIYDMLLPFFITNGAISDDNLGIAESGNGIPDIIDEARNEVDFWLRLRDGKGYSHGLTNPVDATSNPTFYQAGTTAVAAWANAANAAMLSNCFQILGKTALMTQYRDSAIAAYNYGNSLADQQLTKTLGIGGTITGKDLKATAAGFLYNITGNATYESDINTLSTCTSTSATIKNGNQNQTYAVAAYLFSKQKINYPTLYSNMKASIINEAKTLEANYSQTRPSRRSSDNTQEWFVTEMCTQRTIVAHALSAASADKDLFESALILEADWTLGRNPANMIQMTTATTNLASKRSVQNMYTSGWDDGTPGVHPGHTPYMNIYDWGGTMAMGNPTWMTNKNYPAQANWPEGEEYYNTRYVYAANEFTPQQTMRGKIALYAYLYAISPAAQKGCAIPSLTGPTSICGIASGTLLTNLTASGKTFTWYKDGAKITGQTGNTMAITQGGVYKVDVDSNSCIKSSQIAVNGSLQVNLGVDTSLCTATSFVLDAANASIPNIKYRWSTSDTTRTVTATKAGTYIVMVSATNCASVSDTINITSKLLIVTNDILCSAGNALLSVSGTNTYSWFTVATGGSSLTTGTSYTPLVTATQTYYIEEGGGVSGNLGKSTVGTGSSWGLGPADFGGTDKINKVSVTKAVTLVSIAVYCTAASTNVTINFKQGATVVYTKKVAVTGTGKQIVALGFNLQPGDYTIDAMGTDQTLTYENSGATYPYSYSGYISFTYNESWQSTWYGLFYDWKITAGSGCSRTPVTAILNPANPKCSGTIDQPLVLNTGWNLISLYVSPSQKSIDSVFKPVIATIDEVKTFDGFWKYGQTPALNSLNAVTNGGAYLVKMKSTATLHVFGPYISLPLNTGIKAGWNLVGNPMPSIQTIQSKVGLLPVSSVKNFDGFWLPSGTTNSINNFEPGKGYFIKASGTATVKY